MIVQAFCACIGILLINFSNAEYEAQKYCQLVQPGTKLPSMKSCQDYYICLGSDGAFESICSNGYVFDKDAQNCVPKSESNCYFGLSNPCQNKSKAFAYSSKGANWYNYCIDGKIANAATCPLGEVFDPVNGSCVNGGPDGNNKASVVDMCAVMPAGVYYGDFENCHTWHKCSSDGDEEHGACEKSMVFDVNTGYCLRNDGNMCQRTYSVVQGEPSGPPPQEACTSANQKVADANVCSIYYECKVNSATPAATYEWVQFNCQNKSFDVISQQCSDHASARVYPSCDRCEFTGVTASSPVYWANAVDPNCRKYSACKNGKKFGSSLGNCQEGYFYNEAEQYCMQETAAFEAYKQSTGACHNYECNDLRVCSLTN